MDIPEEVQKRIDAFMEGYKKLVEETQVDFANYPVWMPEESGTWKTIMQSTPVDIKNRPQKSPFIK